MAAASNAPLDNDLTRLISYVSAQYNFVNTTLWFIVHNTLLPYYRSIIDAPATDPAVKQSLIPLCEYIETFMKNIRTNYEKILRKLERLQDSENVTNVDRTIEEQREEFDELNRELQIFITQHIKGNRIKFSRDPTSVHIRLPHQETNFKFYNANRNTNASTRRKTNNLPGNNKRVTQNSRTRNLLPSAFYKNRRLPRGSMTFKPVANLVRTYPLGSRGNTTHTSSEISVLGKRARNAIRQEYAQQPYNALHAFKMNMANANAIAKQVRANQQEFHNAQHYSVRAPNMPANSPNTSNNNNSNKRSKRPRVTAKRTPPT
jgi:hypothetical protein